MATVGYTVENLQGNARLVTWTPLTESDDATPYVATSFSDTSVHVYGTFSAGTCTIQGSNETATAPSNWVTLNDAQGNALTITSAKMEQILEHPYQIRPDITAGSSVSVTIKMLFSNSPDAWRAPE